jgi:hypothetical protein
MTQAELSISLGVIATIMVATGSIMVLTGRVVSITSAHASEARVDDIVTTFMSDQRLALTVTERTATSITFTVADRTGDGAPEQICYAWSGVAGDPLTRQTNGAIPVVIARNVTKWGLNYITKTSAPASVEVESDLVDVYTQTGGAAAATVSAAAWQAEAFPLPAQVGATGWRITDVTLWATRSTVSAGTWQVYLCEVDALNKPPTLMLGAKDQATVTLSGLTTTPAPEAIKFNKLDQGLEVGKQYCVIVQASAAAPSVVYNSTSSAAGQMHSATVALGVPVWGLTPAPSRDLKVVVKGRYKYMSP